MLTLHQSVDKFILPYTQELNNFFQNLYNLKNDINTNSDNQCFTIESRADLCLIINRFKILIHYAVNYEYVNIHDRKKININTNHLILFCQLLFTYLAWYVDRDSLITLTTLLSNNCEQWITSIFLQKLKWKFVWFHLNVNIKHFPNGLFQKNWNYLHQPYANIETLSSLSLQSLNSTKGSTDLLNQIPSDLNCTPPNSANNTIFNAKRYGGLHENDIFSQISNIEIQIEQIKLALYQIVRYALIKSFPEWETMGYLAFKDKIPIIYMAETSFNTEIAEDLRQKFHLSYESFGLIACREALDKNQSISPTLCYDVAMLQDTIKNDIEFLNRKPILLLAYASTPSFAEQDYIPILWDICVKNDIWLHVEGDNLAYMAQYFSSTPDLDKTFFGNACFHSTTLHLNKWLNDWDLPFATVINTHTLKPNNNINCAKEENNDESINFDFFSDDLGNDSISNKQSVNEYNMLYFWMQIQLWGKNGVWEHLRNLQELGQKFLTELNKIDEIENLDPGNNKLNVISFKDNVSLNASIHTVPILENLPNSQEKPMSSESESTKFMDYIQRKRLNIVFRYQFTDNHLRIHYLKESAQSPNHVKYEKINGEYLNALNTWFCQMLNRDFPNFNLTLVKKDNTPDIYIQLDFMSAFRNEPASKNILDEFVLKIREKIEIINATHEKRMVELPRSISDYPNLLIVDLGHWAGLGAVQYVPDIWLGKSNQLPKLMTNILNELNESIVHKLNEKDSAFAIGKTDNGLSCIGFGMVTTDSNIEDLTKLVFNVGKYVETQLNINAKISDIISGTIKTVQLNLEKENGDKLASEGVLRHVPVLSSLINWWSPLPANSIKGKSFDFNSGKIEDSDQKAYAKYPHALQKSYMLSQHETYPLASHRTKI